MRAFAAAYEGPLHLLINNAGVMAIPELTLNGAGHEMQLATNHLGHFALTLGLHDALAAAEGARVVCVSSSGHLRSPVIFDDLDFAFREYDPWAAYGQSKTANVLHAVGDHPPLGGRGHLRQLADARRDRHAAAAPSGAGLHAARRRRRSRLKTPEQGAATTVLLATSPQLDGVGGRYFEDCNEAAVVDRRTADRGARGVARYALDPDNADRLWEVSSRLVNA